MFLINLYKEMNLLSSQLEYIRAKDKDNEIISTLKLSVQTILRSFSNAQYLSEVSAFIEILYLSLSYFSRTPRQTLGQELTASALADYSKVSEVKRVLVSKNYRKAAQLFSPSSRKILVYVLAKVLGPYFFKRVWNWMIAFSSNRVLKALPDAQEVIDEISRINFAVFLLTGFYDEIPKRLVNFSFTKLIRPSGSLLPLKRLGYLVLIQSFFSILSLSRVFFEKLKEKPKTNENFSSDFESTECILCLSMLRSPTCPPCGHVFCWDCIQRASQEGICPVCRSGFQGRSLLQLRNY
jgi:peroxin-10